MITGYVNSELEPVIVLEVQGPTGHELSFEAVVVTGYSGYLTLPPAHVKSLGLQFQGEGTAELADGCLCRFDAYEGGVYWDAVLRTIPIDEQDAMPLVGVRLLHSHDLAMRMMVGGSIQITAIESPRVNSYVPKHQDAS